MGNMVATLRIESSIGLHMTYRSERLNANDLQLSAHDSWAGRKK